MLIKAMFILTLVGPSVDAPSQKEEAEALYNEGSVLFDSADYNGAIEKFTKALGIVQTTEMDDHTRLPLLYNIAVAHEKAFAIDKDETHLRQALQLYKRYREFAQRSGNLVDELDVEVKIQQLEKRQRVSDQMLETKARAEPSQEVFLPVSAPPQEIDWKRPRNLGIGLVVGGGVATIGGVVLAALGGTREAKARAQVDGLADMGIPMDDPAWAEGDQFIEDEKRKGAILMGTGVTVAVVGAAAVGLGSYYLAKANKLRGKALSVTPTFRRGLAGVQITGRF